MERQLRAVTPDESSEWIALARKYGFARDNGDVEPGYFMVTGISESPHGFLVEIKFITPIASPESIDGPERQVPPIMFDRNENREIVLPGDWWAYFFEQAASGPLDDSQFCRLVSRISREATFPDTVLPPDTETIKFYGLSSGRERVVFEALPPGGTITLRLGKKTHQSAERQMGLPLTEHAAKALWDKSASGVGITADEEAALWRFLWTAMFETGCPACGERLITLGRGQTIRGLHMHVNIDHRCGSETGSWVMVKIMVKDKHLARLLLSIWPTQAGWIPFERFVKLREIAEEVFRAMERPGIESRTIVEHCGGLNRKDGCLS